MKALALIIVFCHLSQLFVGLVGGLRTFREVPPSLNQDENKRRMYAYVMDNWGPQLKAIGYAHGVAAILLALVVLFG
jgi:hypothetical protein